MHRPKSLCLPSLSFPLLVPIVLALPLGLGCASKASGPGTSAASSASSTSAATPSSDAKFESLAARFLAEYLRRNPTDATQIGEHKYDGQWPDVSAEAEAETRTFVVAMRSELEKLVTASGAQGLNQKNRIDARILATQFDRWLFELDELKEAETNPLAYTGLIGQGLDPLLTRDFAPHAERIANLAARLEGLPRVVASAKKRLAHPPKVFTETALEQNRGLINLCKQGLTEHIKQEPALAARLTAAATKATAALEELQQFLEKELLPRSDGDFRLGRARFEKKLRFALDEPALDIDALADGARALLSRTQEEMVETAKEIWPTLPGKAKAKLPKLESAKEKKAFVRSVLDAVAEQRPTNATIVADAKQMLAEATAFVKQHDLVRVPDEPCGVIEMPEYRRGVAVAYCDSSGPLEKKQETVFAISPTPKDWPAKRALSFYKEYNHAMLVDLTVHEAMPGHFLQLMHSNRFKSDVRAVFGSGPFVEGWAVYAEWLMAKYGHGGPRVRLQRQKMILRLCTNAILDHDVHAGTMDEKGALALMQGEGFQEEGEAVGKWRRARLSSAQLSTYYYGFSEMVKLRERAEKAPGFTERAYHDKLLSFGSPPMRAAWELMAP